MCGRYALALSNEELYDSLENSLPRLFNRDRRNRDRDRDENSNGSDDGQGGGGGGGGGGGRGRGRPRWERQQDHHPTYNIAPRSRGTVIRRDPEDNADVILETMQWGLIPHWTKYPPSGPMNTINARSEGLLDASSGGMWHALKGHKRCIVPAQGYYEWQKKSSNKIAHFTRLPLTEGTTVSSPPLLFFAGLFDTVKFVSPVESRFQPSPDSTDKREPYPTGNPIPLSTFTILTTEPAKDLRWLHDRMPCILTGEEEIRRWLDLGEAKGWEEGKGGTGDLLKGKEGLDSYPVPPEVGKIGTNSPTYIQPVSERADGIKSFFSKQAPSPVKSKVEASKKPIKAESALTSQPKRDLKEEAEVLETQIGAGDEEKGLGDDSNAPNVKSEQVNVDEAISNIKPEDTSIKKEDAMESKGFQRETRSKRKRSEAMAISEEGVVTVDEEDENQEGEPKLAKKGGRKTQVVRRPDGSKGKEQRAITNFFKSPSSGKKAGSK
ncbi:hypothetical protein IAR55_001391 [Kwoniella newhampshirensis]|uniref:DUF159-domain-containing protein n=1 Tax=Kwoniella newhampshirensis TaxID=1651941 RepID=A0AAW0Z210_9TREE